MSFDPFEKTYSHIHFDTIAECNRYANNTTRTVAYFCCGGRGIAFEEGNVTMPTVGKGTCHICFKEGANLVKPCKICVNTLCEECLRQLKTRNCPYCRSTI